MNKISKLLRGGTVVVLLLSLLAVPMLAFAQVEDPEPADEPLPTTCNPLLAVLSERLGFEDCEDELLPLLDEGYGMGELIKAMLLAEHIYGEEPTMEELIEVLAMRQKDGDDEDDENARGWGEIAHATALSDALDGEFSPAEILDMRDDMDLGWGELRKAQALSAMTLDNDDAGDDLTFEEALAMFADEELGWGEIRDALGLEPGPPPWAGPPPKFKLNPGQGAKGNGNGAASPGASGYAPGKSGEKGKPAQPPGQAKKNQNQP
ncbi:MAG: hypothetical protein R3300_18540 [Candidatus Promineifilaceae bacterium]|nr:hypothetical protein [Candidatus Promineifilaceae bacterium]